MKINEIKFYDFLNEENKERFNKIQKHEILGATNHLEIIGDMMLDIIRNSEKNSLAISEVLNLLNELTNHYIEERGKASRSVYNGLKDLMQGVTGSAKKKFNSIEEVKEKVNYNIKKYRKHSAENLDKVIEYSVNELQDYNKILLYDYSSTVEKVIKNLVLNTGKELELYVAESSVIDGGKPFLSLNSFKNISINFFPDAALYQMIKQVDCTLMGAETFYPDGTGFNTLGSDIVGYICQGLHKPLYFITTLNKLDSRRKSGVRKELVYLEYREIYRDKDAIESSVKTLIPELIGVEPEHIYAYITEEGVIPSRNMFQVSMEYESRYSRGGQNG